MLAFDEHRTRASGNGNTNAGVSQSAQVDDNDGAADRISKTVDAEQHTHDGDHYSQ